MLAIETRQIARLIPYVRNARTHSGDQIAQIAGSIRLGKLKGDLVDRSRAVSTVFTLARRERDARPRTHSMPSDAPPTER